MENRKTEKPEEIAEFRALLRDLGRGLSLIGVPTVIYTVGKDALIIHRDQKLYLSRSVSDSPSWLTGIGTPISISETGGLSEADLFGGVPYSLCFPNK